MDLFYTSWLDRIGLLAHKGKDNSCVRQTLLLILTVPVFAESVETILINVWLRGVLPSYGGD